MPVTGPVNRSTCQTPLRVASGRRAPVKRATTLFLYGLSVAWVLALAAGCGMPGAGGARSHEMLNATLWQQSAGEYEGLTRQVFRQARENLDRALADTRWSAALEQTGNFADLPPAIMLDLDETVLSNTRYEVRVIRRYGKYDPQSFAEWCREASAPVVPGADAFLRYAASRGVAVFYYSARREDLRDCTATNLRRLALPLERMTHLLLNDGSSKHEHRQRVSRSHRILLLMGDNLEDFVAGSKAGPDARRDLARRYAARWGREWIVLPNPIYGHWESSFYDFDYRLPRAEQLRRKNLKLKD